MAAVHRARAACAIIRRAGRSSTPTAAPSVNFVHHALQHKRRANTLPFVPRFLIWLMRWKWRPTALSRPKSLSSRRPDDGVEEESEEPVYRAPRMIMTQPLGVLSAARTGSRLTCNTLPLGQGNSVVVV